MWHNKACDETCVIKIWNVKKKFEEMQSTFFFAMTSHPFVMICIIDVKKSYHYKICITLSIRDVFLFQNDDHSKYFHNKNTHTMLCVCLNNKCFCLQMLNTTEYNTNEWKEGIVALLFDLGGGKLYFQFNIYESRQFCVKLLLIHSL